MKRLVVCFDGTWNSPCAETNVHRLSQNLIQGECADGAVQEVLYLNGVGVRALEWLRGGALGYGTGRNIRQAYAWLQQRYEPEDQIYMFGFSRGAFSARSLAGMIARCGLLHKDAGTSVETIYWRYADREESLLPDSRRVPIHFVGVWDTVGALGVPWGNVPGLSRSTTQFHDTYPSAMVQNMFHALAIDEHRGAFKPTLWTTSMGETGFSLGAEQRLEQRWFAGAHSDVGGGHQKSLAHLTLAWMQLRASECGLQFRHEVVVGDEDHLGPIEDSFTTFLRGTYRLLRRGARHYRPIYSRGLATARGIQRPLNEVIDDSALTRHKSDEHYRRAARNLADLDGMTAGAD